MEGLSNPDKIEELWEKSKAKKFRDDPQYNPISYKQDDFSSNTAPPDDCIQLDDYMGRWCNTAYQRVQFPDSPPCSTNPISPTQTKNSSMQLLIWKNIFSLLIKLSTMKTTSDTCMDCIPVRLPTTEVPNLNPTPSRKGIRIRKPQLEKGEPLKGFALPTRTLQRRPKPTRTIQKTAT